MSNQQDFFPNIDPKKPQKPERMPRDNEEDYEEPDEWYCTSCGEHIGSHTTKEIVECALNELHGVTP